MFTQIDTQLIVCTCRTRTGNLGDADKWKIAFAILVYDRGINFKI